MIRKLSADDKDFSADLPRIVAKLNFLATAIGEHGDGPLFDDPNDSVGLGSILTEMAYDLSQIDEALYPPSYHKEGVKIMGKELGLALSRISDMKERLHKSACKLSVVSLALDGASVPNVEDAEGASWIVDEVKDDLKAMAEGGV